MTIKTSLNGSAICLTEEGTCIPETAIEHIWDPFFTTEKNGTGLGLAICYRIALDNGRAITVTRKGPTSTRIEVTFPI